jgi:hypothetical protein
MEWEMCTRHNRLTPGEKKLSAPSSAYRQLGNEAPFGKHKDEVKSGEPTGHLDPLAQIQAVVKLYPRRDPSGPTACWLSF